MLAPGCDVGSTIAKLRSVGRDRRAPPRSKHGSAKKRGTLSDYSVALALCLALFMASGPARPVKAHPLRARHPHAVLAQRHGPWLRLEAKPTGRAESAAVRAALGPPPIAESEIGSPEEPAKTERPLFSFGARGPPPGCGIIPALRPVFPHYPDLGSKERDLPYASFQAVPNRRSTQKRLSRRSRAGRLKGTTARRTTPFPGGVS